MQALLAAKPDGYTIATADSGTAPAVQDLLSGQVDLMMLET